MKLGLLSTTFGKANYDFAQRNERVRRIEGETVDQRTPRQKRHTQREACTKEPPLASRVGFECSTP
jgi:DNA-binding IclR family transcriptional regulator